MATTQFGLLDEREEGELHKIRLLNVEEKPFKRVTKRLIAPGAFTNPNSTKLSTPPPDKTINNGASAAAAETQESAAAAGSLSPADVAALKEDIMLDFAAFDSAIARLQVLASANEAERRRYAGDRVRILGTMDSVRAGNAALRARLEGARATLARRRRFDELADRITGNRMLRPRAEQHANLRKLADECAELERESADYGGTWRERRGQFGRLVDEGVRLRALIRDEKEEVERREGMDNDDGGGGAAAAGASAEGGTPSASNNNNNNNAGTTAAAAKSGNATPRHHLHHQAGASSSLLGSTGGADGEGSATPRPGSSRGDRTPRPDSPADAAGDEGPKPRPDDGGSFSSAGSQASSAGPDNQQRQQDEPEEGEDVEMDESATHSRQQQRQQQADTPMDGSGEETHESEGGEVDGEGETQETPQITVDAAAGADGDKDDKMDTT